MEFIPNTRRANSVFAYLISAFEDGEYPYTANNLAKRPQDQVPADLQQNPNFWFYLCHLMRGMIKSDYAATQVVKLYRLHPELFDPQTAAGFSESRIQKMLKKVFATVPKHQRYAEAWSRNSKILQAWGGNILNVYEGVETETEVRSRVVNKLKYDLPLTEQGFFCFQAKMCALLTYFLVHAGLIEPIRISPPIDFHHMRAIVGTGIIPLPEGKYRPAKVERVADEVCRRYLERFPEIDPVKFADLLFILSREGCSRSVSDPDADWNSQLVLDRYRRSCGECPVKHLCTKTVLQEAYYTKGDQEGKKTRVLHVVPRPLPPRKFR